MKAFEKLAVKRFNQGVLAEEAVTHVIEGLSANDWARCRAFKGNSRPSTYVYSLAANLVEEFARQRFGRPRPPAWLKEQGETWVLMWKLLCLERQLLPSIIDRLSANGAREPGFLESVARTIRARMPNCGLSAMDHAGVDDISSLSDAQQDGSREDAAGFDGEQAAVNEVVIMLRSVLAGDDNDKEKGFSEQGRAAAQAYAVGHREALQRFREKLSLADEERVLLRMIFVDGFSKTAASRAMGLQTHQAGRIVNAALARIGEAMSACGLSLDDIARQL